jgi:hypothetical protein
MRLAAADTAPQVNSARLRDLRILCGPSLREARAQARWRRPAQLRRKPVETYGGGALRGVRFQTLLADLGVEMSCHRVHA